MSIIRYAVMRKRTGIASRLPRVLSADERLKRVPFKSLLSGALADMPQPEIHNGEQDETPRGSPLRLS